MKPLTGEKTQHLKVTGFADGDDFIFDASSVCAEMRRAQATWAAVPVRTRLQVIRRFRHLLAEQAGSVAISAVGSGQRPVAEILTSEIIPLADAAHFLERAAGKVLAPRRVGRRGRPLWLGGVSSAVHREPFGLVLVIAPSNYPIFLPGVQVLQALVAGNAVLLKPGPGGTAATQELARLLNAAGLPAFLLRVLSESPEAAQAAIRAGVDKVFFTGSATTGAQILAQLAPRAIPSAMELSGCDAVIIRADADLELAVRALVFGLRLNSGQTCIAPRRVFVARAVATEFEGRLAQALANCSPVTFSPAQRERLSLFFLQALAQGAHFLSGKIQPSGDIIGPVVIAGAKPALPLLHEDIFAPVLTMLTVADDAEAVAFANDCPYALGATIFTCDEMAAHSLAARLNVGSVIINDLIAPTADARLPFGGRKLSGFGLTRGPEGLLEMTTTKVVTQRSGRWRPHYDAPRPDDAALFRDYLGLAHGGGLRNRFTSLRKLIANIMRRKKTMKTNLPFKAGNLLVLVAILLAVPGAHGELSPTDWSQWRGPSRDGQVTGPKWPASLAKTPPKMMWRVELGPSYSGPITWSNLVFTTETVGKATEVVQAFDRATGKLVWRTEWPGAMTVPFFAKSNGDWIRATPACDGESLFVAGMRDVLVCLDAATGKERWRYDFVKQLKTEVPSFGFVCSPLVDGEAVYVQAGAALAKLNKRTGELIWRSLKDEGGMNGSAFSSPVLADLAGRRQLIVQTREKLAGVDPADGAELWSQKVEAFRGMNILTPVVQDDLVFTSTYGGKTLGFRVEQKDGKFSVAPAWSHKAQGYMTTPVVVKGVAYNHLKSQRAMAIEVATGKELWTSTESFGKYWSLVAQGDNLLALDQNGSLLLLKANPEKLDITDRIKISEAETWAHLAVSGDQLFIRELKALVAYRWSEPGPATALNSSNPKP